MAVERQSRSQARHTLRFPGCRLGLASCHMTASSKRHSLDLTLLQVVHVDVDAIYFWSVAGTSTLRWRTYPRLAFLSLVRSWCMWRFVCVRQRLERRKLCETRRMLIERRDGSDVCVSDSRQAPSMTDHHSSGGQSSSPSTFVVTARYYHPRIIIITSFPRYLTFVYN